jgi:hypothetical protein
MRRDALLFIALGAAVVLVSLVLWIGFRDHLRGWALPIVGMLLGVIAGRCFGIGVRTAYRAGRLEVQHRLSSGPVNRNQL